MVNKSIANEFQIDEQELDQHIMDAFGSTDTSEMLDMIDKTVQNFEPGAILSGKIVNHIGDDVIVEVGLKSEGTISSSEFDDPDEIRIGKNIEVLLEAVESDSGLVILSKRKADRIRGWERIIENYNEGDTIKGKVTRRIKGGLLVDVGVPVFLPASQVDIRRPGDISQFIGNDLEAKILKIDQERRNIVISRRKLLEETRASAKSDLLGEIELGQIRKGMVKNIADFGAFIDLGGLDGLLHITDMSWGRVNHPSELLQLDQEIEVKILSIDREREKIALGLKQKTESPWVSAEQRYQLGSIVKGTVVNITNYGAFIKLEEGIEGLVHISEMSWTKRITHPSELLTVNQEIEVVVLQVNPAKQEISLGIKQLSENPWTQVSRKYPPGSIVEGHVRNLANYGAFIEIEEGIDGLLHVSDMSWTKKIGHPGEMIKKNEAIKCVVLSVDEDKQRVSLGLKQMTEDPWLRAIPDKYIPGQIVKGQVTKITNFGVFVELESDLEGLLHVSELSDQKVEAPQDIVKVGEELEVKILRVDTDDRKIGLSLKRAQWAAEDEADTDKPQRGGLDGAHLGTDILDHSMLNRNVQQVSVSETSDKSAAVDVPAVNVPEADVPEADVPEADVPETETAQVESDLISKVAETDSSGTEEAEATEVDTKEADSAEAPSEEVTADEAIIAPADEAQPGTEEEPEQEEKK
ncbi:MAG: 30S ribosomal protein S1 [Sedimentisphaerales bacterium]|nr:30S ribosomal protein S1 [Sedimentisphaerales bacterium]